jgi:hypothetical protein
VAFACFAAGASACDFGPTTDASGSNASFPVADAGGGGSTSGDTTGSSIANGVNGATAGNDAPQGSATGDASSDLASGDAASPEATSDAPDNGDSASPPPDGGSPAPDGGGADSAASGFGVVPPLAEGGAGVLASDAGTVAAGPFAETGCTAGSPGCYPFAQRRLIVRDEGNAHLHLIDLGNPSNDWSTITAGPFTHDEQLVGIPPGYTTPQVMGGRTDGYEYYDLATGRISHPVNTFYNTVSAYRLRNGNTMLTATGGRVVFLDRADKAIGAVTYTGHGYVRLARPAPPRPGVFGGQTLLVPSDTTLFEGDLNGQVVKAFTPPQAYNWAHLWMPLVRRDGSVLVGAGFAGSIDVVDWSTPTPSITFRYGTKAGPYATADAGAANPLCWAPGPLPLNCPALSAASVRADLFAEFQILPNGNILATNWPGTAGALSPVQILEFNPAGEVVWYYRVDPNVFAGVQGVLLLDGLDPTKLNVEDTDDGTWQSVQP